VTAIGFSDVKRRHAPPPSLGDVVNAPRHSGAGISPGSLETVFGTNLAAGGRGWFFLFLCRSTAVALSIL